MISLPPGWSQHVAPTGHFYYYNSKTKESTYHRPEVEKSHKRKRRGDYPKFKIPLTGPWVLVFLKSGRRFVHNLDTKESLWIPPPEIQAEIDALDKDQLILLIARARGLKLEEEKEEKEEKEEEGKDGKKKQAAINPCEHMEQFLQPAHDEPVDYKLLEEPDNFDESEESSNSDQPADLESDQEFEHDSPLDDLDDLEDPYADISDQQRQTIFSQLLDAYDVNPYKTWESALHLVIDDPRYDVYDSSKQRSEAFDVWARIKIAQIRQAKQTQPEASSSDAPASLFIKFIQANYSKKLLYIDFKRKFRKQPEFSKSQLSDKDKEKLFREFSLWMKKSIQDREHALKDMATKKNWQDILEEPLYYTLPRDTAETIHNFTTAKQLTAAQEEGIKRRQQQVEEQKHKQRQELRREKYHLQKENEKVAHAIYDIDSRASLRDHLQI